MPWIKAFHIIFIVAWFAGLFYLPRLFVYHATASDFISIERFKLMERRLYFGIMTPAGILATIFGIWALHSNLSGFLQAHWMQAKLLLVLLLWIYQIYLGKLLFDFKANQNKHSDRFYRWLNEFPTLILFLVVILVVVKPF